ncbi:uncharacterized protein A4U43_C07F50 [Asparagus officinalis]|uniref:Peptidase M50 domain-containing protein n=1 Tax=Asparagus officinalis TaxID=4686 RepID=A0A5P1ED24_ASPOF|nr:uncharacterized protein A4U43_C07F50 [Asparagus officinalis]
MMMMMVMTMGVPLDFSSQTQSVPCHSNIRSFAQQASRRRFSTRNCCCRMMIRKFSSYASLPMPNRSKRRSGFGCQAATTETEEPESHDDDDDDKSNLHEAADTKSSDIKSSLERIDGILGSPGSIKNKDEPVSTDSSALKDSIGRIEGVLKPPDSIEPPEKVEEMEVASGSPLPGMKQLGEPIMIPKATIDILKDQVFGFDTFFITRQEPYERGVLFKGNLRGTAAKSFEKITKRMQDRFGDQYRLFLLINPEDDEPVAVVVPKQTLQPESTAVPEWFAASAFGLVTIFTLFLRNVPALQSNLLSILDNLELLKDGLPGALVTALVLGIHELGHILVARDVGAKLGVPYFVPSWQIGSFGAITRIVSIISNREELLKLAAAGPFAGFSFGLILLLLGFILPPSDGLGIVVDPAVFHESFLVGGIVYANKLIFLYGSIKTSSWGCFERRNSTFCESYCRLWGIRAAVSIMLSIAFLQDDSTEADISFALWGRKASSRLSSVAIGLLGISSLFNDVAFYWVVLIFFLQRGPIAPLSEEITDPPNEYVVGLGVAVLLLGLLVCLPYPFPFVVQGAEF